MTGVQTCALPILLPVGHGAAVLAGKTVFTIAAWSDFIKGEIPVLLYHIAFQKAGDGCLTDISVKNVPLKLAGIDGTVC